ncbi:putative uncharacterized protein DDB_G0280555 [Microplitis mediator]|uniref:putative uncharacterized protein DDB_G0280555 n=1 Tax=Microplitis mediator TaxID=375433 RepID=UPI002556ACC6|nr:putative uncharacterized protein DDB_G0280555 [Microplitis mediator]
MTTLQDVSAQLMKPAKDLADWNFPLSKVLESYYTLLDQQEELNFGEAALVLQNSANVYVRRVESLYQETTALQQSFLNHEHEEEAEKGTKSTRRSRKTQIDFKNFDLLNLSSETIKNSTQKSIPSKIQKIKLINQRYPQLENITRQTFTNDIIDINGETIGKKYDFRCNQQLSTSRMLIDAITPLEFTSAPSVSQSTSSNCTSESSQSISVDSNPQNLDVDTSPDNTETDLNFENFDSCSDYDTHANGMLSPTIESAYGSTTSNSNPNTPSSRINSDFSAPISDSSGRDSDEPLLSSDTDTPIDCDTSNELIDESDNVTPDPLSDLNHGTQESGIRTQESETRSPELVTESTKLKSSSIELNNLSVESENIKTQVQNSNKIIENCDNNQSLDKIPRTRDSIETDAGYTSGDPDDCQSFSPIKRLRSSVNSIPDNSDSNNNSNINSDNISILDPIPFESSVPDKLPRLRREFKLPCHVALLKGSRKTKKRKLTDNEWKKNQLKSFLMSDNESLRDKKLKKLIADNKEEIKRMFNERKELVEEIERANYCPVMIGDDLVGYESRLMDDDVGCDDGMRIDEDDNDDCRSERRIEAKRNKLFTSYSDGFYSSPRSLDDFSDLETTGDGLEFAERLQETESATVDQSLMERIERKMEELRKEFDVRNEREEESAKWLETMEALKVVANRPSFHVDEYEKRILDSLKMKETHQVDFHEIAENEEEPGNIARLFVASLHLANTYNVEINVNDINSEVNLTLLENADAETS